MPRAETPASLCLASVDGRYHRRDLMLSTDTPSWAEYVLDGNSPTTHYGSRSPPCSPCSTSVRHTMRTETRSRPKLPSYLAASGASTYTEWVAATVLMLCNVSHPKPFLCEIRPRSQTAANLARNLCTDKS